MDGRDARSFLLSARFRDGVSSVKMSTQATVQLAIALPPQVSNEAPPSSSLAQAKPFSTAARQAFYLILEGRNSEACELLTATDKYKYIRWLTESVPE